MTMTSSLRKARGRAKVAGSNGASMPRPRKQINKREAKTPGGRFALHLQALLEKRGWDHHKLAELAGVKEFTVRSWLRGEALPESRILEAIGKALNTKEHPFPDYRLVLPPPKA
jgi:ribosome-binding protein aMBF1 (putative translation factor)